MVNAVLSTRTELMAEFKRGEHSGWDLDKEIRTWEKRKVVLAGGEVSADDEDKDKLAPAIGGPKPVEVGDGSRQSELDVGEHGVDDQAVGVGDIREQGQVEPAVSYDDITKD